MSKRRFLQVFAVAVLMSCNALALAAERGYFGFVPKVSAGGFLLNPVIKRITIDGVTSGSPAAQAGIASGDEVVRIEDTEVIGSKALKLRAMAEREIGQTLHLTLRHVDGTLYKVAMVAVARP